MKFRMVDKIVEWQAFREIRGIKAVSFEEYKLKTAFGEEARLPESLVLESLFQLGNWLVVLSSDYRQMGRLMQFESVRFLGAVKPGQRLTVQLQVKHYDRHCVRFGAQGLCDTKNIVQMENCVMELVRLADYQDPNDLRVLYSEFGPMVPDYSLNQRTLS